MRSSVQKSEANNLPTTAPQHTEAPCHCETSIHDNRPETAAQLQLQKIANGGVQAIRIAQLQQLANNNTQPAIIQKKENKTGLPDQLKSGIEQLSGHSMDDVKVHRNSDKPATLQAHAYAQGTDIHLGPGQEKHLPHEAWHVVQQKQGRVKPTLQMRGHVNVNDDMGLEKEADVMGAKAMHIVQKKEAGETDSEEKKAKKIEKDSSCNASLGGKGGFSAATDSLLTKSDNLYAKMVQRKKTVGELYQLKETSNKLKTNPMGGNSIFQFIGGDQQGIRDDGNRTPAPYQIPNVGIMTTMQEKMSTWGGELPTLKQFESATSKFLALRSSDVVLTQIDGLLTKFHQLGGTPANVAMKIELVQEIILASEFWLKRVNRVYTGKKPTAAVAHAPNLGGTDLKLKGEEERRPGILALSVACSAWLQKNHKGDSLSQILNNRSLENQGVTAAHANKDVVTWDQRSAGPGRIFPETAHRADWNNSRGMHDQDYVVLQNDDQKRTAKLVFRGGKAYRWQQLLNPNSAFSVFTSNGNKHFVMDKRGHIYTGSLGVLFFHSSLVGFADALSAGFMRVHNGRVDYISNDSGHYKPNVAAMVRVLRQLQRYGVNVNGIEVERMNHPDLANHIFTGAEILESDHLKWPDQ